MLAVAELSYSIVSNSLNFYSHKLIMSNMLGKIAVPITASNLEQALKDIAEANRKADLIELRLDFLRDSSGAVLKQLKEACKKPVIVAFRNQNFGATAKPEKRLSMLKKAIEFGTSFVDIGFEEDNEFARQILLEKGKTKVILSFHDFEKTPAKEELLRLFKSMAFVEGADAIKIVTFANSEEDNGKVLSLIPVAKRLGKPIIAFCMGPKGKKSRVQSLKKGSMLGFAALSPEKASAEGQLECQEFKRLVKK